MLKAKKIDAGMIAVVVLSVLLAIAVATGATMAWFASSDSATGSLGLTGAVNVSISKGISADTNELSFSDVTLVPSHPLDIDIEVTVPQTTTPFLLRARFELTYNEEDSQYYGDEEHAIEDMEEEFLNWLKFTNTDEWGRYTNGNNNDWGNSDNGGTDGWWYLNFDGGASGDVAPSIAIPTGTEPASESGGTYIVINDKKHVPHEWNNEDLFPGAVFDVKLVVQAVQAEFYSQNDPTGTQSLGIYNVGRFFDHVFSGDDGSVNPNPYPGEPVT